jgi:hypothetical protein
MQTGKVAGITRRFFAAGAGAVPFGEVLVGLEN